MYINKHIVSLIDKMITHLYTEDKRVIILADLFMVERDTNEYTYESRSAVSRLFYKKVWCVSKDYDEYWDFPIDTDYDAILSRLKGELDTDYDAILSRLKGELDGSFPIQFNNDLYTFLVNSYMVSKS